MTGNSSQKKIQVKGEGRMERTDSKTMDSSYQRIEVKKNGLRMDVSTNYTLRSRYFKTLRSPWSSESTNKIDSTSR
jgi:hypothetical protein